MMKKKMGTGFTVTKKKEPGFNLQKKDPGFTLIKKKKAPWIHLGEKEKRTTGFTLIKKEKRTTNIWEKRQ